MFWSLSMIQSTYMLDSKDDSTTPDEHHLTISKWSDSTPSHQTKISNLRYQMTIVLMEMTGSCLFINVYNNLKWLTLSKALKQQVMSYKHYLKN